MGGGQWAGSMAGRAATPATAAIQWRKRLWGDREYEMTKEVSNNWRTAVIGRYPHPGRGFTQGLVAGSGAARETAVWESTGLYGESAVCRYRLGHQEPQKRA